MRLKLPPTYAELNRIGETCVPDIPDDFKTSPDSESIKYSKYVCLKKDKVQEEYTVHLLDIINNKLRIVLYT